MPAWTELVRRAYVDAQEDDILGLAAQLSYYFFLALFPAILFGLGVASFFPLGSLTDDLGAALAPFVSPQVVDLIQDQMRRIEFFNSLRGGFGQPGGNSGGGRSSGGSRPSGSSGRSSSGGGFRPVG